MPHEEHTVTVTADRPIDQVFAYLSDEESGATAESKTQAAARARASVAEGLTLTLRQPSTMGACHKRR